MMRTLLKTVALQIGDRTLSIHYFERRTARGTRRYSAEILLGPEDYVILDGDSVESLEAQAIRCAPATLLSRSLAARRTAA
jgi:hypothetical protein